jgi:acetyl esterase/lipase
MIYLADEDGKRSFYMVSCVYKSVGGTELSLTMYLPGETHPKPCPAVLFFFGGGFKTGTPEQFRPQSEFLAERGIAGITADYRVLSRHGVTPTECLSDALDAAGWVHAHAAEYGIDSARIAVAGGSSGGYLACAVALTTRIPAAAALFNPLLDLTEGAALQAVPDGERGALNLMPKVRQNGPPMVIFQGDADQGTPLPAARRFAAAVESAGGRCTLHVYPGEDHGFFNKGKGTLPGDGCFWDTLRKMYDFLTEVFAP